MKKNIITYLSEGSDYNIIQDIAFGFQKSQLLFTAIKYDVFSLISEGENTLDKLVAKLDVNKEALERLLNAIVSIDLLDKNGLFYINKSISEKHLTRNSEEYYGFLSHYADLWESWGTLTNVLKTGEIIASKELHEKNDDFIEYFLHATDWYNKLELPYIKDLIKMEGVHNFLKIGACGYRYPLYIAEKYPNVPVYILDNEKMLDVLQKILKHKKLPDNLNFMSTDSKNEYLEKGNCFEMVYMDSLIDKNSILDNINSLQNIYNLVANGGRLLMHFQLINDARTEPTIAALQSINLLLNTKSGSAYTKTDLWVILREAGFGDIQFYNTNIKTNIIEAHKSNIG